MTVTVNGKPEVVEVSTLAALVETLGLTGATIGTALNGSFVPRTARLRTVLSEGDRVEIVAPMQGG